MKLFNKVAIVGLGLIGGSLALAMKKKKLAHEIMGLSRKKRTINQALKSRAIDSGSRDLSILKDADLVILATPVGEIIKLSLRISQVVKPGCIVFDVGSTKKEITRILSKIFTHYVGTHPLAGSEKHGLVYAQADIFKDSLCILTPVKNTKKTALAKVKKLWQSLGAKTVFLTPERHDKILSFVSHLPHLVAFALISSVPQECLRFASSGLKDTTRIAASEGSLWSDIFLTNRKNLFYSLGVLQKNIQKIRKAILKKDKRQLNKSLLAAKIKRESIP